MVPDLRIPFLTSRISMFLLMIMLLIPVAGRGQDRSIADRAQPPVDLQYTTAVRDGSWDHYQVTIRVRHLAAGEARFFLPRWAPGAYRTVAWYTAISEVSARMVDGRELAVDHPGETEWVVTTGGEGEFLFSYLVEAKVGIRNDKPVLNNRHYLHSLGGLIDGPASWMYLEGSTDSRILMHFDLPEEWVVATGLNPTPDPMIFWAEDYDWLIDCPTMTGSDSNLHRWRFTSWGVPFEIAWDAAGEEIEFDTGTFVESIRRVVDCQADMYGGFPFEHFTFLYDNGGGGGLEHLRSTTIGAAQGRLLEDPEALWNISAHEFYHVWNVKRIRPKILGPFDYQRPNRTQSLWVSEGMTETYTAFTGVRAGFTTPQEFYDTFATSIASWMGDPAQPYAPPARTSWTTWDRNERNPHGFISYYTQGEVLGMALDLIIREATDNRRSLDDVMRILMNEHGGENLEQPGFGTEEMIYICSDVAGTDLYDFFEQHVLGTVPPDWGLYLGYAGLAYEAVQQVLPDPGFTFVLTEEGVRVRAVSPDGPVFAAGLRSGDRILKTGEKVAENAVEVYRLLMQIGVGEPVVVTIERDGVEQVLEWLMPSRTELRVGITEMVGPTARQMMIRNGFVTGSVGG
ncbi:PDZ domain-containing protein [Candidatus Zixiibacteriota bacterium]